MEQITEYLKPELLSVAVILFFIGKWLARLQAVREPYIPLIKCGIGIALCAVWVLASCPLSSGPEIAMAVFTAVVQGVLAAGLSTFLGRVAGQRGRHD